MNSPECPLSRGMVVAPPSEALGALSPDYYPDQYGEEVRRAICADFGDISEQTLDALELQRHLSPVVEVAYANVVQTDPLVIVTDHDLANHLTVRKSLVDVRSAINNEFKTIALRTYQQTYGQDKAGHSAKGYHDTLAARYLAGKETVDKTAQGRLLDGIGTATNVPYKLMSAYEDFAVTWGIEPKHVPRMMHNSWRMLHTIAELDLDGYTFWTGALLEERQPGVEPKAYRFSNNKWIKLLSFDQESMTFSFDISPRALGKLAIPITETDIERWGRVNTMPGTSLSRKRATTGADRLRCPITRMPKEFTQLYANLWADMTELAGLYKD